MILYASYLDHSHKKIEIINRDRKGFCYYYLLRRSKKFGVKGRKGKFKLGMIQGVLRNTYPFFDLDKTLLFIEDPLGDPNRIGRTPIHFEDIDLRTLERIKDDKGIY